MTEARDAELVVSAEAEAARAQARRLVASVAGVCALLAALGFAFEAVAGDPVAEAAVRSSYSPRADGFLGLPRLLEALGLRVARHRASYGALPDDPAEAVLLVLDPKVPTLDPAEARALRTWVRRGGRVVVALPGADAFTFAGVAVEQDDASAGAVEALVGDAPPRAWEPAFGPLRWDPGLIAGDERAARWPDVEGPGAHVLAPPPAARARLVASYVRPTVGAEVLPGIASRGGAMGLQVFPPAAAPDPDDALARPVLATERGDLVRRVPLATEPAPASGAPAPGAPAPADDDAPAPDGVGDVDAVWLVSSAYPFTNLALSPAGEAAPWVHALLEAATEGGRRRVLLDERCHGLSERRGLLALVRSTPLRAPVAAGLALVVLLAWRGGVRRGAPRPPGGRTRRAQEEFVVSLAALAEGARRHHAAATWIVDAHRLRARGREPEALSALAARLHEAGPGGFDLTALQAAVREADHAVEATSGARP